MVQVFTEESSIVGESLKNDRVSVERSKNTKQVLVNLKDDFTEVILSGIHPHANRYRWYIASIWIFGIVTDVITTVYMMSNGLSEEGNTLAVFGMSILGDRPYVLLASIICLFLMIPALGSTDNDRAFKKVLVYSTIGIGLLKAFIAIENVLLWMNTGYQGVPWPWT